MLLCQFLLCDDTLHQVFREVTFPYLLHLLHQQVAQALQRLSGQRHSYQQEGRIVAVWNDFTFTCNHLLGQVQVEVQQTSLTVVQYLRQEGQGITLVTADTVEAPAQQHRFGVGSYHFLLYCSCQFGLRLYLRLLQVLVLLPVAKVLYNDVHSLIGVEVTTHTDSYIVGHIVLVKEGHDILQAGILQVLAQTNH